jgi:glycerol kinase
VTTYLLAIDQGTTSSRAIIFSRTGEIKNSHQIDLTQSFPKDGWVEQDPIEIWNHTLECCRQALKKSQLNIQSIAAIGISNQRETTILWNKKTGIAIYPAIVWQDRRTSAMCKELLKNKISISLQQKTGLLMDPYFAATKIMWLLQNIPGARDKAERGELAFGTIDSFLLWNLSKGKVHATDATNASRTLLFNIHTQEWDQEILDALAIPPAILPTVLNSSDFFGEADESFFGKKIAITAMIGDQQAATVGQACFHEGMVKATYGTGSFVMLNTGDKVIQSEQQLLSTIAYRINNKSAYALEGSIFSAGVIVKWLRDNLKLIKTAAETADIAASIDDAAGVYLVPAFTGLGAPYWKPDVRAALMGMTLDSSLAQIVRAGLEAIAYQTRDLLEAMQKDLNMPFEILRVDGGMAANHWLLQFIADQLNIPVERPCCIETSALGAAYLAGLYVGCYSSLEEISELWKNNQVFLPTMPFEKRERLYRGWEKAVESIVTRQT